MAKAKRLEQKEEREKLMLLGGGELCVKAGFLLLLELKHERFFPFFESREIVG